jgi:excisionase family DNA binding protein
MEVPMNNAPAPLAVDVKEAARLTSFGKTKIYEMLADGTLPSRTIGRRRVIPYSALKTLVEG